MYPVAATAGSIVTFTLRIDSGSSGSCIEHSMMVMPMGMRVDRGGMYIEKRFRNYFSNFGVTLEIAVTAYSPTNRHFRSVVVLCLERLVVSFLLAVHQ